MLRLILAAMIVLGGFAASASEYIIKYKPNMMFSLNSMVGVQMMDQHDKAQLMKVKIDNNQEIQTLDALHNNPAIEYVVKNFKLKAFRKPLNMTELREQWALAKVNAERAWGLANNKGDRNVVVGVIDTGIDYNHESLAPNMVPGYDFKDNDNDPMDETGSRNPGHGTHCAGIIGATGLVAGGISGLSSHISIMPIRFLGADGGGDLMAGIRAIDYAIENGVDVISASWGATIAASQAQPLIEAVKRASDAGVIFVSAAANDGRNNDATGVYPANADFDNTITVAASDSGDAKASFSNYGKNKVHVAAPGVDIMSTIPNNQYRNLSGTSMATPLVAGLVALLKSQNPELTGKNARALIQTTGAQVDIETACNCRIDAGEAMNALLEQRMFIAPAAKTIAPNETLSFDAVNANGNVNWAVTNASVGSIAADGTFTATANGETTITATDSEGRMASTLNIYVTDQAPQDPGGDCPLGDPALCQILCGIQPDLPFCNGL
ncbi:MAG: protease [Bdellovibrionaceae bacterium]|nr:protease [Pseudobdellovibrionaceae bacterium]